MTTIRSKLIPFTKMIMATLIIIMINTANAEYYLVYGSHCTSCTCRVYHHVRHKHKHHHYVARKPRNTYHISVYYYVPVYPCWKDQCAPPPVVYHHPCETRVYSQDFNSPCAEDP